MSLISTKLYIIKLYPISTSILTTKTYTVLPSNCYYLVWFEGPASHINGFLPCVPPGIFIVHSTIWKNLDCVIVTWHSYVYESISLIMSKLANRENNLSGLMVTWKNKYMININIDRRLVLCCGPVKFYLM